MRYFCVIIGIILLAGCSEHTNRPKPSLIFGHQKPNADEERDLHGGEVPIKPPGNRNEEALLFFSDEKARLATTTRHKIQGVKDEGKDELSLSFVDTPINEVVRAILGETLGRPYYIHRDLKHKITFRTSQPVPKNAILGMLEKILNSNQILLQEEDNILYVLPTGDARTTNIVGGHRGLAVDDVGYGTHIIPLKFVPASSIQTLLSNLLQSPTNKINVDVERNFLFFTGSSQERGLVTDLINMFDVDALSGKSFGLIPVATASIRDFVAELEEIFSQEKANGMLKFIPIKRLGSVLIVAHHKKHLEHAYKWVERLDKDSLEHRMRLFVYYTQYNDASSVANTLSRVFKSHQSSLSATELGRAVAPGESQVELDSDVLSSMAIKGSVTHPLFSSEVNIIADNKNNVLFILSTHSDFERVKTAIEYIDSRPRQILIEAMIVEVALRDELNYGVQWFFESESKSNTAVFSNVASGPAQSFPGFSYLVNRSDGRAVLNALDTLTDVEILSSPQLLVLDNHKATLQVGDQVPVTTQSSVNLNTDNNNVVNSVELLDTGVILEVTPRISHYGSVLLDIVQEVSTAVETKSSGIDTPTIQRRRITSKVLVEDGQSIALGGLMQTQRNKRDSGVPFVSKVPVLGNLFKSNQDSEERTELIVLITPHVIYDSVDSHRITTEIGQRMRSAFDLLSSPAHERKENGLGDKKKIAPDS